MDRFFHEGPIHGQWAELDDSETHHLLRVLRAKVGDRVIVFDGTGTEYLTEVASTGRNRVVLRVIERRVEDRELPGHLTIAAALPKGERQKWLVEKLVELGVSRFVPLNTKRSVCEAGEAARARLSRAVVAACKQCGRNRLMEIAEAGDWHRFVAEESAMLRLVAHPESRSVPASPSEVHPEGFSPFAAPQENAPATIVAAIGPEGGFTADEITAAIDAGWRVFDLGPRTLRVETAAVCTAALLGAWLTARPPV